MLPSPDTLNDFEHGKFVLSNLAAKRAKQLREGAPALVQVDSTHPLTIALAEIAAGKIKPIMPNVNDALEDGMETPTLISEDTLPAELGMLLPALDETEAALISTITVEEDHETDPDAADAFSLSDLVDEEDTNTTTSDDDTLSLSDIAEQESEAEDDDLNAEEI